MIPRPRDRATQHLSRGRSAVLAGLLVPLAVAAILLPWRASWSNTNVALLLVVAVVAVAVLGSRTAGALAAVSAFAWFDFFFTRPYERFTIRGSADITTAVLLLVVGLAVSQLAARARQMRSSRSPTPVISPRSTRPPRSPNRPRRPGPWWTP